VTCPYILDGPDTDEVILLDGRIWCMGHIALGMSPRRRRCPEDCPIDFGPWGAWRAGLAETMDAARHYNEMGNLKRIVRAINATGAVGWLP
jgi:hypothetical protein